MASTFGHWDPVAGATGALEFLRHAVEGEIPAEIWVMRDVDFLPSSGTAESSSVSFPCPFREQDATAAIKALEGCVVAAIADLRYKGKQRAVKVDLDRTTLFLMSAYVATIDGVDKAGLASLTPNTKVPNTDLNRAQSAFYRRLSANLYRTKENDKYYHIHGSLEANTTLRMLGLPPDPPRPLGYRESILKIQEAVRKFTVDELEQKNSVNRQAGAPVLRWEEFRATDHSRVLEAMPPFSITQLENTTPPVHFPPPPPPPTNGGPPQALAGIKVLELCRVIAGPVIGRSLAAHGAQVLKVTSVHLPDVPFFQVDVNTGKHTTSLHLDDAADRATFDALLADADVLIDGYRPGALARFGCSPENLARLGERRGRGFVYVAEDCFGGTGEDGAVWSDRPGWQQIADCVTGVAWAQGNFMQLGEPVVPPFPMSDYGTGALGCVAALVGLYRRATMGGSWACRTSLVQYDVFLMKLGLLPREVQDRVREEHDVKFFALRHADSVDEVGKRALKSVRNVAPHLFEEKMMVAARGPGWNGGKGAVLRWPREALHVDGLRVGYSRASRPNGCDKPTWEDWEVDEALVAESFT